MAAAIATGTSSRRSICVTQLLLFTLLCGSIVGLVSGKHLSATGGEHQHQHQHSAATHHRRRLQRDSRAKDTAQQQCEAVKGYFESIDIHSSGVHNEKGAICGGSCCSNATEMELRQKASGMFEQLLHHHTSSLRGILADNANQFQSHVLELAQQSENKTLTVFSKVYIRMVPLSGMMIRQLYTEIMNHLNYISNYTNSNGQMGSKASIGSLRSGLEDAVHKFFVQLFPVAYHQAVHLAKNNYGELHEDYINCLKHNFDELQPFGGIPREIQSSLVHSVHMSNVFMNALLQSAEVLSEADALYGQQLTDTCKMHLLKMHYCPNCNGHQTRGQPQICNGYCMNVMRGCSAEYAGLLDGPWSSVVEALNNLVTTHIVTDSGIINTIMKLSTKISDAIMHAMGNGPELEQKVKKTCGTPNLSPSLTDESETRLQQHKNSVKWATPPDPDMVRFLSTIEKTKEFYTNIVDNFCDAEYTTDDRHCWTGDRIGDYTQLLIDTGMDRQRYNPEVPWKTQTQVSKLNELVDKLIKIRKSIGAAAPSSSIQSHDIQSDMGREGSGGGGGQISDDDEEYGGGIHGSGDGSGDGATTIEDRAGPPTITETEQRENNQSGGASNPLAATATCLLLTLVTILYRSCS
ncbi:division abnormally delayed protein [Drosophila subobscura]|uniref:division abnormally delayed protein n=1 Tax=Drosophila subobscura TaxID=7241 RepID=UPI00155AF7CE|nr:division abnormally delayed protein [Drosophila subobscura]